MSRILIVEDNETMRTGIALVVERMGHEPVPVASGPEGLGRMREEAFDLVITDYRMAEMDGLAVLDAVKQDHPDTDVILITAYGTVEIAVAAMKNGAVDFVSKPFSPDELRLKLAKVLEFRETRQAREKLTDENRYLREEIEGRFNFGEMVGQSAQMKEVFSTIQKVAASESSVLIYGESGTGKELVARAIHGQSPRREGPFVKVNCGALPRELVESELFGHEKGAFTGAVRQRKGKFELAEGGTIFLDEIGDLPTEAQVNLLRVLQEKAFDRVGGEKTLTADVRVVAATNRPLKEMVSEGNFREDLFYRLEVIPILLSPLRERKEDIPDLVAHFVEKKCKEMNRPINRITPEAMKALSNYGWPGNVRELENVIERTIVLSDGEEIDLNDLPLMMDADPDRDSHRDLSGGEIGLNRTLDDLEKQLIKQAIEKCGGVKARAAQTLGIKTSALYYKLEKYGLG